MSVPDAPVLVSVRNRVGHLTLNRADALNTLTLPMVRLLSRQLQAWKQDPDIVAVVLRGTGEKAFCAGGDIRALYDGYHAGNNAHLAFFEEEYALDKCIHTYPKPVVALLDGFALGGGMGLVQGADFRVITERVKMGMPETGIGFFPDVGGSYFLSRLAGELGTYLGVAGIQVRAADALYAQLADWCLPSEQLAEFDHHLDNLHWSAHPSESLCTLLSNLAVYKLPGSELKALRPAIDEHFAQPDLHAIRASLLAETRPEFQDWAEETVRLLDSRSPLAMGVTLELLHRGRNLPLDACFALEFHLAGQWFANGDFLEGVRALIIDKDKSPRWNPQSLAELTPARVAEFFRSCGPVSQKSRQLA